MSLPLKAKNDLVNGFRDIINQMGTRVVLTDSTGATQNITAHWIQKSADDAQLVNAVGIEAQLVVTHGTPTIKKFDLLTTPSGRDYTVHAVHEVWVNEVLVGQKLVVKS